jgi:hypothetical protein
MLLRVYSLLREGVYRFVAYQRPFFLAPLFRLVSGRGKQTPRKQGDLTSLRLFFRSEDSRLKTCRYRETRPPEVIVISRNVVYTSILEAVDNVQHSNIGMVERNAVQVFLALDCISFLILLFTVLYTCNKTGRSLSMADTYCRIVK